MYLKIEQGSKEDYLRKINQLILKILEYAAKYEEFDKDEFIQFVEEDEVWSAKSYSPGKSFYNRIKKLIDFPQEERENIYRVIQHDVEFDRHIEDPDFVFEEHQLSDEQKEAVNELILYLYNNPFRKGKFVFQKQTAGYREFKASLFERNSSSICPACLAFQTNLMDYGEVDHYFPKKSYPALIFHPMNLSVICGECNGTLVKGEKDIFEMSNLTELYIPYLRHAEEEVELRVRRGEENEEDGKPERLKKMMMVPRGSDADELISKRIQNLDKLFDLSKRWTDRMYSIIKYELEDLKDEKLESEVQELLHNRAKDYKRQAAKNKSKLLEATTLTYMENEGKESFFAEWRKRQDEHDVMSVFNANA